LGWSHKLSSAGARKATTSVEFVARLSPGGWGAGNSDADLAAFTTGRVTKARYASATLRLGHDRPIGDGVLSVSLTGQWASGALPDSQQMSMGGLQSVRGYLSDDAVVDQGVVIRTEYRMPVTQTAMMSWQGLVFADAAHGGNKGGRSVNLSSIGLGLTAEYGRNGTLSALVSYPLASGATTRSGQSRFSLTTALRF
jgi:hemolysin activation/secretion protein